MRGLLTVCTLAVISLIGSSSQSLLGSIVDTIYPNASTILNSAINTCGSFAPGYCHAPESGDLIFTANPFEAPCETNKIPLTAEEIVAINYPNVESHNTTSLDGTTPLYLLRIPKNAAKPRGGTCLLIHGTFQSVRDWVVQPNTTSLAMRLSEVCDVWIMGLRGTVNSVGAKNRDGNPSFWNYNVDTQIEKDLPAVIDYILDTTGDSQMVSMGYSLGGTLLLGLLASNSTYNQKIQSFIGLHAPAYHGNATSPIWRLGGCLVTEFPMFRNYQGSAIPESFNPAIWTALTLTTYVSCRNGNMGACGAFLNSIFGTLDHPTNETYEDMLPVVTSLFPNSESMQTLIQTLWDIQKPYFRKFDYGTVKNLRLYGTVTPPSYNVTKITTNVTLYCSKCDAVVDIQDCDKLVAALPKPPKYFKIQNFNHIDPFYGRHIQGLYNHIVGQVTSTLGA